MFAPGLRVPQEEAVTNTIQRLFGSGTREGIVKAKFVVVHEHRTPDEFTLYIGWVWVDTDDGRYLHKSIYLNRETEEIKLSGGMIDFWVRDGKVYRAMFHGKSVDFGVFDYRILSQEHRQEIAQAFGITVEFIWQQANFPKT